MRKCKRVGRAHIYIERGEICGCADSAVSKKKLNDPAISQTKLPRTASIRGNLENGGCTFFFARSPESLCEFGIAI